MGKLDTSSKSMLLAVRLVGLTNIERGPGENSWMPIIGATS